MDQSGSWDALAVALPEVVLLACDESSDDDEDASSWPRKRAASFSQISDEFTTRKLRCVDAGSVGTDGRSSSDSIADTVISNAISNLIMFYLRGFTQ